MQNAAENILEVSCLSKRFSTGNFEIQDINFNVPRGTIFGLVGENGAGKTTFIKIMMNMYSMDAGRIVGFGNIDSVEDEPEFKEKTGFVLDDSYFDGYKSVRDIAKTFSVGFEGRWDQKIFDHYISKWNIDVKQTCLLLSKGTKTKLMLALALAHKPELLVLDEPTSALDPAARLEILDLLRDFVSDGEHSVIFSTHITEDLEKVADYIGIMIGGKMTEVISADEAQERYAVISGENLQGIEQYLIGTRKTEIGFEALVKHKDLANIGDVTVRMATFEDILIYRIRENKEKAGE